MRALLSSRSDGKIVSPDGRVLKQFDYLELHNVRCPELNAKGFLVIGQRVQLMMTLQPIPVQTILLL